MPLASQARRSSERVAISTRAHTFVRVLGREKCPPLGLEAECAEGRVVLAAALLLVLLAAVLLLQPNSDQRTNERTKHLTPHLWLRWDICFAKSFTRNVRRYRQSRI